MSFVIAHPAARHTPSNLSGYFIGSRVLANLNWSYTGSSHLGLVAVYETRERAEADFAATRAIGHRVPDGFEIRPLTAREAVFLRLGRLIRENMDSRDWDWNREAALHARRRRIENRVGGAA